MGLFQKVILTGFFCVLSFLVQAQGNPHKVNVRAGYGFKSMPDLMSNLFSGGSDIEDEKVKVVGPLFLALSYNLTEKIEFGFSWSYNRVREEGRYKAGTSPNSIPPGKVVSITDSRYTSIMMLLNVTWNQENKVKYYSGGAFGTGFVNRDEWFHNDKRPTDSYKVPAFQITPVGVSYGERVIIFGEVGFGMHGLLNGGLLIKL